MEEVFFEKLVSKENIKNVFKEYVAQKTDYLTLERTVKVPEGLDNIDYQLFQKNISHQIDMIFKRIRRGNYFFYPLREIVISKDPQLNIKEAKRLGKTRVLSIASIRDVITQKMLYDFLNPITEKEFTKLPYVSFAYRKNVNAQKAAQKVYSDLNEGYIYALDADLKGFFDNIPHDELYEQIVFFFTDMPKIQKLLYRFIHVDKGYKNKNNNRVVRIKRAEGIPQGGIISGMLANIYLHQFDCWIMSNLSSKYNIRYTRYADDFIVLGKSEEDIIKVKDECEKFLQSIKLILHPDPEKTKISKVTYKKGIDFVGFTISKRHISIKQSNVLKFKKRIESILTTTDFNKKKALKLLKLRLSYKYFVNEYKKFKCKTCGEFENSRNWMKFFLSITDHNQLKAIDNWVYKSINYYYFKDTGKRLQKSTLKKLDFPSLEKLYYEYRKQLKNEVTTCKCTSLNKNLYATEDPYKELFNIYP